MIHHTLPVQAMKHCQGIYNYYKYRKNCMVDMVVFLYKKSCNNMPIPGYIHILPNLSPSPPNLLKIQ